MEMCRVDCDLNSELRGFDGGEPDCESIKTTGTASR